MATKKLSEKTEQYPVNSNPVEVIKLSDHYRLAIIFKLYLYGAMSYSSYHEKRPISIYGWVFKPDAHFCVRQLSGKNILFFTFNRSVSNAQFFLFYFIFCQISIKLRPPITWLCDIMG